MVDTRLNSMGNVRFRWYDSTAFANLRWPLVTELNSGQELEQVTLWDNFEVGAQASETADAVPIGAKANVVRRAAANYGGTASFWYPGYRADLTNAAALVYAALKDLNTDGYIALSVDGDIGEAGQPAANMTFANGDLVTVMRVVTDEWDDMITGEDPFYYTRTFLKAGGFAPYTVASTGAPVLTVTIDDDAGAAGDLRFVTGEINDRDWTRGLVWSTSDDSVATVSATGVVTFLTDGTADITATIPGANPAVSQSVTVTVGAGNP